MKGIDWMSIRSDYKKGMSFTELGRKYNIDPRTAKKYALSEEKPAYMLSKPKRSKLDPYKRKIDMWLEEAPYSAVLIHEKLLSEGCDCKYTIVREYVSSKKKENNEKATVRFETMPGLQG